VRGVRKDHFRYSHYYEKAYKEPGKLFKVKSVQNIYDVSGNTARKLLRELEAMNISLSTKIGQAIHYIAPSDLSSRLNKISKS
jgi:Fic family protein